MPELFWIAGPWRGSLAIAKRPRAGDWLHDEMAAWRSANLDVAVSLLEPDEASDLGLKDEATAAEGNGLRFISFPIRDRGIPISDPDVLSCIATLASELEHGRNVAVHCRQSIGRAGMIAAAVLILSGATPTEAIRTVSAARGVPIPETAEQRQWLERLPAHLPVSSRQVR